MSPLGEVMLGGGSRHVPERNGVELIFLGLFGVAMAGFLYYRASRHKLPDRDSGREAVVKWVWGYGFGLVSGGCVALGIIILATGR